MPLNFISIESLTNGEIIALDALEIVSIPHISIIDDRENAITEIVEKYKNEILYISFDHDLGEIKTGYDIAKYLVENEIKAYYNIHSANPVGRFNIEQLLQHYGYEKFDFLKNLWYNITKVN